MLPKRHEPNQANVGAVFKFIPPHIMCAIDLNFDSQVQLNILWNLVVSVYRHKRGLKVHICDAAILLFVILKNIHTNPQLLYKYKFYILVFYLILWYSWILVVLNRNMAEAVWSLFRSGFKWLWWTATTWQRPVSDRQITGWWALLILYVNKSWCNTALVRESLCTPDIELLSVSLDPFYLPRVPQLFMRLCIHLKANVGNATKTIMDTLHRLKSITLEASLQTA